VLQGAPFPSAYLLSDMAADATGLLDALGIARAHVVGASMGGAIAQLMAIHHADRLLSLTSIMATTGAIDLPLPTPKALALLFKPAPRTPQAYLESYAQTVRILRGPGFPLDESHDLQKATRNLARGLNPAGSARQLAAIFASGSRREALRSVQVPTLVIHGRADPLVPVECGIDTAGSVPGARLLILEGMGHFLPMPMWGKIIDAISAHASGAPSSSAASPNG
jgi:pimeloyl-ACP methyl ester carboxylesterase